MVKEVNIEQSHESPISVKNFMIIMENLWMTALLFRKLASPFLRSPRGTHSASRFFGNIASPCYVSKKTADTPMCES